MGLFLIGTSGFLAGLVTAVEVAVGLGFLIFVHELGHFVVAKWCGVKCEKFYLGFDIAGLKLCSFRWGETEYGIGILPLGGYVKMLGQDDNPSRAADERERSKLQPAAAAATAAASATTSARSTATAAVAHERRPLDPRSYMAQSIPERMAIISAGVIMNLIAAVLLAAVAYKLGVSEMACAVGGVAPGEPAYRAGMRSGDRIVKINDRAGSGQPLRYEDLLHAVIVGDIEDGIEFDVLRPGEQSPVSLKVVPDTMDKNEKLRPTIGVTSMPALVLADEPAFKYTPAAAAGKFQANDRIVAVDGAAVRDWPAWQARLIERVDRPIEVTVERGGPNHEPAREVIEVGPAPLRMLGLTMKLGDITAIQPDSPAASVGLRPGERIESIDGQPPGDTTTLDERLRRKAGQVVELELSTGGDERTRRGVEITPRNPSWSESPLGPTSALPIPALGLAVAIENEIVAVEADGPAAGAELAAGKDAAGDTGPLQAGDRIKSFEIVASADQEAEEKIRGPIKSFELASGKEPTAGKVSWAHVQARVQLLTPSAKVRLVLADGRSATIVPVDSPTWHDVERGFSFLPETVHLVAEGWGEAFRLGLGTTGDSSLGVFRFIGKIFSGQVSPKNLGGIGTIATVAAWRAGESFTAMLIFLTVLSANLAMINILPIPVLDGGHLMFLIWEAIRGKPPNEVWHERLTWLGLAFVLFLIIYSNGLDIGRLFSWLTGG